MIELSFREFHQQQYEEHQFCLYIVKDENEDILYVGISTSDIWERWFGFGGHLTWDGETIYGESAIGTRIENHLPGSLEWKIQLWSLRDCLEFCGEDAPTGLADATVHDIEPIMIQKLSPALNTTYNLSAGKITSYKSKKEIDHENWLDQAYRDIFD